MWTLHKIPTPRVLNSESHTKTSCKSHKTLERAREIPNGEVEGFLRSKCRRSLLVRPISFLQLETRGEREREILLRRKNKNNKSALRSLQKRVVRKRLALYNTTNFDRQDIVQQKIPERFFCLDGRRRSSGLGMKPY